MKLVLDTTVLIDFWRHRRRPEALASLRGHLIGRVPLVSWMTLFEFARGHFLQGRPEESLRAFLAPYTLLPVTEGQTVTAAKVAAILQAGGHTPGLADVWIAAAALEEDVPVLTRNVDHFLCVPGL